MLKNLIWYRAGMAEGGHPMLTGFFRLKDRRQRRRTFQVEGRLRFAMRRVGEIAYTIRAYAGIYLEVQELWLKTRIRRDEYAFLGDLRRLASRSMQEVKLSWVRVHSVMAERLGAMREGLGSRATPSEPATFERLEAMRLTISAYATALETTVGEHAGAMRESVKLSRGDAGRGVGTRAAIAQRAFADLRLKYLPPVRRRSLLARLPRTLNLFSMQRVEPPAELVAYWRRTWEAARRLQFWRLNPFELAWHAVRDARHAVIFFFAMVLERY
jgi:hypothetical protein